MTLRNPKHQSQLNMEDDQMTNQLKLRKNPSEEGKNVSFQIEEEVQERVGEDVEQSSSGSSGPRIETSNLDDQSSESEMACQSDESENDRNAYNSKKS